MPRSVVVSLSPERADSLVGELSALDGLVTLQRQRGVSLQPPGDVVTVTATDRSIPSLMKLLSRYGAGRDPAISVATSEPSGLVSASSTEAIAADASSSSFEEMEFALQREATMGVNKMIVMGVAGALAAVGIATNAVHLVIGAMLIAPGFEPFLKISLGTLTRSTAWKHGLADTAKGYLVMVAAGGVTALVLPVLGVPVPSGSSGYLRDAILVDYWTQVQLSATFVALIAGTAGAVLVASNRSVLTAGVMVALALVPGAALTGVGIATADADLVTQAVVRFVHDATIVLFTSAGVFGLKRASRGRPLQLVSGVVVHPGGSR